MSKLIAVTFAKVWRGFNVGEVAGFSEEVATELVSTETATLYDPSGAAPAAGGGKGGKGGKAGRRVASAKPVVSKPTGVIGAGGGAGDDTEAKP